MTDWDSLLDEADIASVLPDAYAHYWRPIKRALTVFLEGLPETAQETILLDQAMLPQGATVAERVAQLARSCPALHKLGQTLARDRRLLPELRLQLQRLESLPPSISIDDIRTILTRELGPLDQLGVVLEPPALAEGSVAVVIPFRCGHGEGVFKVLKAGIEDRLEQELALLERVGVCLDEECEALGIPQLDYRTTAEGLAERLRQETRLDIEQRHLKSAAATYANDPRILVPALFEFCTPCVTAMERVYGGKVTDCCFEGETDRQACTALLVSSTIVRPILSAGDGALFHGDPHAGNLLLTPDRRLAIIDWSLATTLAEEHRVEFVQIVLGAVTRDAERIAKALGALSEQGDVDRAAVLPVIEAALGRMRKLQPPGLLWVTELLDNVVHAGVRFDSNLLLLRKMLLTLEGVIADIGTPRTYIDSVLISEFIARMAIEWPSRWLAPPNSRAFPTRLSNADLAGVMMKTPLAAIHFWLGFAFESGSRKT